MPDDFPDEGETTEFFPRNDPATPGPSTLSTTHESHMNSASRTQAISFDEAAYLAVFEDVNVSLDLLQFGSALEHYEAHGRQEGRLTEEKYIRALGFAPDKNSGSIEVPFSIDSIFYSSSGFALIIGWIDDRTAPLDSISIFPSGEAGWNTTGFGRLRREDAESLLQTPRGHLFGFWAVLELGKNLATDLPWKIRNRLRSGHFIQVEADVTLMSGSDLRTTVMNYFASLQYNGNRDIESFVALETDVGRQIVQLNRSITDGILAGAWVSYHGPSRRAYDGSVVVCIFGKPEFLFLQAALFSQGPGAENYEFIYVSNSPELTEALEKEARLCARIYGLSIVLVCLPDNAGFGAANNVAARYARSHRILITNPDVFPRDSNWARRHADIVEMAPVDQTRVFGAPLYYDDGSLMHHGMYFEIDAGISVRPDGISAHPMIRTEHYAKGAPAWSKQFPCPRKVPAVTGAFISADRAWFESLGGFSEDYLFGHYEDADFCLKSLINGHPVWIHDFPLWHMEGKGSTRRPEHEGGMLVNRWLFTRQWGDFISSQLSGSDPSYPGLRMEPVETARRRGRTGPAGRPVRQ